MSEESKAKRNVKLTMLALGVIFLVITSFYLIKIINGDTCGSKTYSDYTGKALTESTVITTSGGAVYQNNVFDGEVNVDDWRFCFTANASDNVIKIFKEKLK